MGVVPAHWQIGTLKRHMRLMTQKTERRANAVGLENVESWTGRLLQTDSEFEGEGVAFEAGDLLFGKLRPYLAKVLVAQSPGEAVGDFLVLRSTGDLCSRFTQQLMLNREFISIVDGSTFGSKMPRASWEFVGTMTVSIPPLCEQDGIVSFLERETSKFDALVAEQQRLIELLKEKKDVAVSRAVAVGRGETTTRLGHLADVLPGYAFPSERFSEAREELRLLRGINVAVASCRWDDTVYWARAMDPKLERFALRVGDIVLGMDRPWIGAGTRVAQIREEDVPSYLVQRVARMRARSGYSQRYLLLLIGSREFREHLEADLTGVSVPHISEGQIASFPTRVLTLAAQEQLVAEVARVARAADALILESERAIALLQERRTALISAAVTGKIDVRHLADAEAA